MNTKKILWILGLLALLVPLIQLVLAVAEMEVTRKAPSTAMGNSSAWKVTKATTKFGQAIVCGDTAKEHFENLTEKNSSVGLSVWENFQGFGLSLICLTSWIPDSLVEEATAYIYTERYSGRIRVPNRRAASPGTYLYTEIYRCELWMKTCRDDEFVLIQKTRDRYFYDKGLNTRRVYCYKFTSVSKELFTRYKIDLRKQFCTLSQPPN